MWPIRTTDQKEESMDTVSQGQIISIDVSRDWLDIHRLPEGQFERFPNTNVGHQRLTGLAGAVGAIVCFEATGGQERDTRQDRPDRCGIDRSVFSFQT